LQALAGQLQHISARLIILKKKYSKGSVSFDIPSKWMGLDVHKDEIINVNPFVYFLGKIDEILNFKENNKQNNLTYRISVSDDLRFEHNLQANIKRFPDNYFQENGTFLKAIAILPYLKYSGFDTIELHSVNYAKNPYETGDNLSEEALEMSKEDQLSAFLEACHLLDMKVNMEFDLVKTSANSDLALTNPEFFYWIKQAVKTKSFRPIYLSRKIKKINQKIKSNNFDNLPAPDEKYRSFFTQTPIKVARVEDKIIGLLQNIKKPLKTNECVIAPAFPTFPISNENIFPSNSIYFKFYIHPDFNYIAYNTIDFPDSWFARDENINRKLWEYIQNIIPHFLSKFDIDGIILNSPELLPKKLKNKIISQIMEVNDKIKIYEDEN
jgi:glycosidase